MEDGTETSGLGGRSYTCRVRKTGNESDQEGTPPETGVVERRVESPDERELESRPVETVYEP